jgi:hypothetical protein
VVENEKQLAAQMERDRRAAEAASAPAMPAALDALRRRQRPGVRAGQGQEEAGQGRQGRLGPRRGLHHAAAASSSSGGRRCGRLGPRLRQPAAAAGTSPERLLRLDVLGLIGMQSPAHLHALRLVEVADAFGAARGSMRRYSGPIEIAWFGHSGSHTSQLMHSSVIISAMVLLDSDRPGSGLGRFDAALQPLVHRG